MTTAPIPAEIGVGIIGCGTVGTGTARLLLQNAELIRSRVGAPVVLRKVADVDTAPREGVPQELRTTDPGEILKDPSIHVVVELVGGTGAAREFLLEALRRGKSVVTANKALLALHGAEIAHEVQESGADLCFEAAVGGGIPIIRAMREGLAANRIREIYGIINGTCNYILTRMTEEGLPFEGVLADAQAKGLAEADPSFDVDGVDSAHKICILSWLATGGFVSPREIFTEGIRHISPTDIAIAREFGYTIKLLGIAKDAGGGMDVRVHPTMIPSSHLLATVAGADNAIYVKGDFVGASLLCGKGAGMNPTASAVAGDVIEAARNLRRGAAGRIPPSGFFLHDAPGRRTPVSPFEEVQSEFFLRFTVVDKPGVLSKIAGILGNHQISILSVLQKGKEEAAVPIYMVTHHAREKDLAAALAETDRLPVVVDRTRVIRIENNL